MTTIERVPTCQVDYCPAPTDPDWHHCLVCDNPEIHHHHTEGRGPNLLKKESVVALCLQHHDLITLKCWFDIVVYNLAEEPVMWSVMDLQGRTMYQARLNSRQVGENGGQDEEVPTTSLPPGNTGSALSRPASAGAVAGWRASDLALEDDTVLAQDFHHYFTMSGILKLEAFRRIEAYRLKYAGVAPEAWVQRGRDAFDLAESTLYAYSRAWQAFESQVDQQEVADFAETMREMGGGAWELVARQPEDKWPAMTALALSVVADTGVGRGLPSRIAARAQEEGIMAPPKMSWRCPECGHEGKQSVFKVIEGD